jgi:flagellar assembly factor FliW
MNGIATDVAVRTERTLVLESERFGTVSVPAGAILLFPEGLVGFPAYQRFAVLDHRPESPFRWLLCLDDPELAFAVIDPADFFMGYDADMVIGAAGVRAVVLAIVTIPRGRPNAVSANLMAPVVVNLETRTARQVILDETVYSTRHPLLPPAAHA